MGTGRHPDCSLNGECHSQGTCLCDAGWATIAGFQADFRCCTIRLRGLPESLHSGLARSSLGWT
jgi:hypothetical protein